MATQISWILNSGMQVLYMGYAWWLRGFIQRNQYFTKDAISSYREAVSHFRTANIDIYLAGALNDLGYALCEEGNWIDAKPLVEDALKKRRALGSLVPSSKKFEYVRYY